jgi:peptidoglycan/xylan/chitin deacetylase (PgdA/CDA1 family)
MSGTLCVTVDNLGCALKIGTGEAVRPDPDEPGLRALPRVLDLFETLGITATFFVEGWNGLHHPEALRSIASRGHEIGLHGWVHEKWSTLTDDQREVLLFDGTAALRAAGVSPVGFRAPGGYRGGRTAEVLAELGYAFDSSVDAATELDPLEPHVLPEGLVTIPWHWEMIDYWHYVMHPEGARSPEQVLAYFTAEMAEAIHTGGLVTLILHPFVSFVDDDRYAAVRTFLAGAAASSDVDVVSAGELAARCRSLPIR